MSQLSEHVLKTGDALLIVDVQNDFLPGGALPVSNGDMIINVLNEWIERCTNAGRPIFATYDWHPDNHCSFREFGGPWPSHCVAGSQGAEIASALALPASAHRIPKAGNSQYDSYSGFNGTALHAELQKLAISRLIVGGLATDYCVRQTVLDGLSLGYRIVLLPNAMRAVDLRPGDGQQAMDEMLAAGATILAES